MYDFFKTLGTISGWYVAGFAAGVAFVVIDRWWQRRKK